MKLTPQQQQIVDMLADGRKHCPTVELFMKDDRKRISELRYLGFRFNEGAGFCEDVTHGHRTKVKVRQLLSWPETQNSAPQTRVITPFLQKWQEEFSKPVVNEIKQNELF